MTEDFDHFKKKYDLPSFEALNDELDLSGFEDAKNPLRFIVKRIGERLEFFADLLGNLVQPDSDPASMYECNAFSDEDREKLPRMFKHVMYLHREYLERELNYNEAEYAKFILQFCEEWNIVKKELSKILSIMKASWKRENKLKSDLAYYG